MFSIVFVLILVSFGNWGEKVETDEIGERGGHEEFDEFACC
jgi:hypothetical protein